VSASDLSSGKGHTDENFPVASWLIAKRHRAPILAFYRFARTADDVADHPTATPEEKLHLLEEMDRTLTGELDSAPEAHALRLVLEQHNLSPQHALLLLEAFRRDVTKLRYANWDELMDYCRYSAMPVGRFVLDVHGEDRATYEPSDALCVSLQVLNHLQDCAKDLAALDRCYLPEDLLARCGASLDDIRGAVETPKLRRVFDTLLDRVAPLNRMAMDLPRLTRSRRLRLETAVIVGLAHRLAGRLRRGDPIARRVKLSKGDAVGSLLAALRYLV